MKKLTLRNGLRNRKMTSRCGSTRPLNRRRRRRPHRRRDRRRNYLGRGQCLGQRWPSRGWSATRRRYLLRRGAAATDAVRRGVVHAATAEHEGVDADADVRTLGLDALPDEHARALDARMARYSARLRADLVPWRMRTRVEAAVKGL